MSMAKKRKGTQAPSPQEVPLVTEICSMDDIFPGFLQWYKERQARADKHKQAVQVHPLEQGLFEAWKQAIARGEREHE